MTTIGTAVTFADATDRDVEALSGLHAEAAAHLTAIHGEGRWSKPLILRRIDAVPGRARVRLGRLGEQIVSALRLQTRKPWAIDVGSFTPAARPLYLTDMVVAVSCQGRGVGRAALADAHAIAREWPADAIRLDAYDAPAGAGGFYEKCGYVRRARVTYKGNPLVYYEMRLDGGTNPR